MGRPRGRWLDARKRRMEGAVGPGMKAAAVDSWELGADVVSIGVEPDGRNINEKCGAMHPEVLAKAVLEHKADVGIALDGDADRVQLVDEKGRRIDGDQVMGLIAASWQRDGLLRGEGVVATEIGRAHV